jgi:general nucleoside transport system permease protein
MEMPGYLLESTFYVALVAAGVRMAAPLIFAAIGETVCEHAGVINIGLEGTMLMGTWAGFMGMYYSDSGLIGILAAMAGGMATTAVLGYICISRGANQIISGIVVTIFAAGFTSLMYRHMFREAPPTIDSFPILPIPYLSDIPVIGRILFQHTIMVYAALLIVPVASFIIYRTQFGLCLRAAGELPAAVDTAGVNVIGIRYISILICGALAGIGGAALSIGQLNQFSDGLTAGRGYIALAVVLLGKWQPGKVLAGTLFFATADALQLRLQVLGFVIPKEVLGMIPYLLAISAMAIFVQHLRLPAAMGRPYGRE